MISSVRQRFPQKCRGVDGQVTSESSLLVKRVSDVFMLFFPFFVLFSIFRFILEKLKDVRIA